MNNTKIQISSTKYTGALKALKNRTCWWWGKIVEEQSENNKECKSNVIKVDGDEN